tara:strand:+ start:404 stop:970 length:567 start_codon:yes stop_codon:yes gene_type:complete
MKYLIIPVVLYFIYYLWKNRKIRNSHKIPQEVNLKEFNNPDNNPEDEGVQKGHKLKLSRGLGNNGYSLFVTIHTNGKTVESLEKIIFSWDKWEERVFNFNYFPTDDNVEINGDTIKIDIGSFNNCSGSKNFLKRTSLSNRLVVELLDFIPDYSDYEYEKNTQFQSVFMLVFSRKELIKFKQGLHYIDS